MKRRDESELLDRPGHDVATLAANLRDIERLNRWFGGYALTVRALESLVRFDNEVRGLRILDVGAGTAGIARAVGTWARRRGIVAEVTAVDASPQIAEIARDQHRWSAQSRVCCDLAGGVRFVVGDARALPFCDGSFDVAMCSLLLHHLSPADAVIALREMRRVASHGVIVNDLVRSVPAYVGAWLVSRVISTNPLTRNDAPLSVRRAYTTGEIRQLAAHAGLSRLALHRHGGFRVALVARELE